MKVVNSFVPSVRIHYRLQSELPVQDEDVWLGYFQICCRSHIRRSVIEYCNGLITKVLNNGLPLTLLHV
jgi:hypothetical protein